jgi:hypothetical protein
MANEASESTEINNGSRHFWLWGLIGFPQLNSVPIFDFVEMFWNNIIRLLRGDDSDGRLHPDAPAYRNRPNS